ncbi:MAG: right-handed parallel beta-helix repeat-containing protein [Gaiellaceae bacterium]
MLRALGGSLLAGVVLACSVTSASAAPVVDGKSGHCSDARPARAVSARKPWCSLDRALEAANGTVLVRAGTYAPLKINGFHGRIAFRAWPRERPTLRWIDATDSSGFSFQGFRFTGEADMTNVSGFSFTDNLSTFKPNGGQTLSGYVVTGASRGTWQGNTVSGGWIGVHFRWGGAKDITIAGNRFRDLGGQGVHLQDGSGVLIARNRFEDIVPRRNIDPAAHADAVQCLGPSRDVVFDGNRVTGGRGFLVMFAPTDDALPAGQTGMVIRNNVFTGRDFGIRVFSAPGIRILDNRVWGSSGGPHSGIDLQAAVGGNLETLDAVLRGNVVKRLDVARSVSYTGLQNRIVHAARW